MIEEFYATRKAESRKKILSEIDLLPKIPHAGQQIDMALFGLKTYRNNIKDMSKEYFHSKELSNITFTPATTAESISAAAYRFADFAKPKIFDPRWLQAGWIVEISEGFFANPPIDRWGNHITNEKTLKSFLKSDRKVNGIYLLDNDFGFASYKTFNRGTQDCDTFARGGLARILEHTREKEAKQLKAIASPKLYKIGVNVLGFDDVKDSTLRVVSLDSGMGLDDGRLLIECYDWNDDNDGGAFGVLINLQNEPEKSMLAYGYEKFHKEENKK